MNRPMNTLLFKTPCLTSVFFTCIFSQTLYETDHQQYSILNRKSNDVSLQSLLDDTEALLKEKTSYLQKCMDMKDSYNDSLIMNNQEQTTRCAVSNLALKKPANQSSTHASTFGDVTSAKFAVDGNNGTDFAVDKCATTEGGDTNPWWLVDLNAVYFIKSVRIFNRGMDIGGIDVSDRLRDVIVTVGLTKSDVNTPCGFFAGPGTLSQLVVIDCPTLQKGRFVKISKTTEYLTLCEVEVFGYSA